MKIIPKHSYHVFFFFALLKYKPILSNVLKEKLFMTFKFYFLGLNFRFYLRMLCFVLGKFWKESKISIVYGEKGDSSGPRIIYL